MIMQSMSNGGYDLKVHKVVSAWQMLVAECICLLIARQIVKARPAASDRAVPTTTWPRAAVAMLKAGSWHQV
jgi:hypothetical protein